MEEQVRNIRSNTIAKKSRNIYNRSNVKFLKWLYINKRYLLTNSFLEKVINENNELDDNVIVSIL